jgi:predicted transposase/invertase (TIGR01784 family)
LEGIEEGKQQEKINVARNLKQKGTELDTITEVTGLSRKEIEKL